MDVEPGSHIIGKHSLEVSESRVLRRMSVPMRVKVIGEWRKLNNEELHNL